MQLSQVKTDQRKNLDLRTGDTVRVYQKVEEKGKTRVQQFEGLVLARKHGAEAGATFTVRRTTDGYGTEKIFPLYSPTIDKIEIVKRSKTRRSKLYNIRRQAIKQMSKRMRMMMVDITTEEKEVPSEAAGTADNKEVAADEVKTETEKIEEKK
ncbi:MAG TPA: 50S ribosomal protein L19 [Candidatus Paceibacterota bacterium]|nr:50S ribosomal protein L19 [Candidatus Paceibacterota bacterium]HRZ34196.1 50S ribosomal protein L19 [Candidatus Paceibacterota bacterium]